MGVCIMNRRIAYLGIACMTVLLSACADMGNIKPQAQRMDANTLGGGSAISHSATNDAALWPQQQWWHAYGDAQLDALIATALSDSPSLHLSLIHI